MRLSVEKESLLIGLTAAQKAVATKTTMPMLECFHLIAKNYTLTISATDLDLGIEYRGKDNGNNVSIVFLRGVVCYIFRKMEDIEFYIVVNIDNIYFIAQCFGSDAEKSLLLFYILLDPEVHTVSV